MAQVEGPIVDSLWEAFIISWHANIAPLKCAEETAAQHPPPTYQEASFDALLDNDGMFRLPEHASVDRSLQLHNGGDPHWDKDLAGEIFRLHANLTPESPQDSYMSLVSKHLSKFPLDSLTSDVPDIEQINQRTSK